MINPYLARVKQEVARNDLLIDTGNATNKKRQEVLDAYGDVQRVYNGLCDWLNLLAKTQKYITICMNKYRAVTVRILEQEIKNTLDLVLPDEHFEVKIEFNQRGSVPSARLLIGRYSKLRNKVIFAPPVPQNGGLVRQAITVSATAAINIIIGSAIYCNDEALCSGDRRTLSEIQALFESLIRRGIQVISVEHEEMFYAGMPRLELSLEKDRIRQRVVVTGHEYKDLPPDIASQIKDLAPDGIQQALNKLMIKELQETTSLFSAAASAHSREATSEAIAGLEAEADEITTSWKTQVTEADGFSELDLGFLDGLDEFSKLDERGD